MCANLTQKGKYWQDTPPLCHLTPMTFQFDDVWSGRIFWFECEHCGCSKDTDGKTFNQETGELK